MHFTTPVIYVENGVKCILDFCVVAFDQKIKYQVLRR